MSWLRVFAICGVVSIHTVGHNAAEDGSLGHLRGQLGRLFDFGFTFAVPVFVMLSGAMMLDPARYHGPRSFLRRRAARLVPTVVFWHAWYVAFIVLVIERDLPWRSAAAAILNGRLYTALYFFWIVLGLSLIAPLLVPFIRDQGRRGALYAGAAATMLPVLMIATTQLRGTGTIFAETAFTWWIPYLGYFILGYALRGTVLRGPLLWAAVVVTASLAVLNAWQWRNPDAPAWLQTYSPVGYYSATGAAFAVLVYLVAQATARPGGILGLLASARMTRVGRTLGDATLGVFALHLTVLYFVQQAGIGGPDLASPTTHEMFLRLAVVLAITWAIVLVLRKVPFVRALL